MNRKTSRSGPLTQDDLELLGYHAVEEIAPSKLGEIGLSPDGGCRLFSALAQAGIGESLHAFAYLRADARGQDAQGLEKAIASGTLERALGVSDTYVVAPSSILNRPMLKPLGSRPRAYEDLMWGKIQSEVSEYMDGFQRMTKHLQEGVLYVEPSFKGGANGRPTERLREFLSGKGREEDGVIVVRGDAGLGKSTLAAKVAHALSDDWHNHKVVPILLRRATWQALVERSRERHITNLWDIVSLALEQNLQGQGVAGALMKREYLFKRILRQGYAALIFDGFDELPKMGGESAVSPGDNFRWLSEVALDSSARIILTTRPAFWEREMGETAGQDSRIWDLVPFSKENAYEYFTRFFDGKPDSATKINNAKQIYSELEKSVPPHTDGEFINLPICADMIAEHVEKGGKVSKIGESPSPAIQNFFMGILEREMIRQQIKVNTDALYRAFQEIAIAYEIFPLDDIVCTDALMSEKISDDEISRMREHAFIRLNRSVSGEMFQFKGDFLANHLKASYVYRLLMDLDSDPNPLISKCREDRGMRECIEREADGGSQMTDHLVGLFGIADLGFLTEVHGQCGNDKRLFQLKSFLFHVIAKAVPMRMQGKSRKEYADEVLSLLGGDKEEKRVSGLSVLGPVGDISIDGWEITDSHFVNLSLTKCKGNRLHFANCQFKGSLSLGGAQCQFLNCKSDVESGLVISQHSDMKFTDDDIRVCLRITLGRFWHQNVRTISMDEWKTGRTKGIEERFSLLDLMLRFNFVCEKRHRLEVQAIADLREFMENNRLRGSVREIFDAMKEVIQR